MTMSPLRNTLTAGCLVCSLFLWTDAEAEEMAAESPAAAAVTDADWLATLRRSADALQWSDNIIRHDWRLQHRAGTDACRILDPRDEVVEQGSRRACLDAMATLQQAGKVPAVTGPTVIVLHGLGEGRRSMLPLVASLRKNTDATVLSFGYASTSRRHREPWPVTCCRHQGAPSCRHHQFRRAQHGQSRGATVDGTRY